MESMDSPVQGLRKPCASRSAVNGTTGHIARDEPVYARFAENTTVRQQQMLHGGERNVKPSAELDAALRQSVKGMWSQHTYRPSWRVPRLCVIWIECQRALGHGGRLAVTGHQQCLFLKR
jgi:hypothetical protein